MNKILIIEDDPDLGILLKKFLCESGFEVFNCPSGTKGISFYRDTPVDVIICDFRLGDMEGTEVLKQIKEINPQVPFIMMTGYSDIRMAVNVIKMGALDYLAKPLIPEEILRIVKRALKTKEESPVIEQVSEKINSDTNSFTIGNYIFSNSVHSTELLRQIDLVAATNYSVIIYGESGV